MLSDRDIRKILNELKIEAPNPNFPFRPEIQIQPCSIDLRVSEVFWTPKRFRRIDLSDNTPLGPKLTRAFTKRRMEFPRGYLLRPGRFVLCRTYESFAVPQEFCGRLIGRSSGGRMGLTVAPTSNFINPGWHGFMPLVIVNNSVFPIRLQPYLSLVQLCLIRLSSQPEKTYGHADLGSKYNVSAETADDGGPSRYWLDDSIKVLRGNLSLKKSSAKAEKFLEAYVQELDEPTRKRFIAAVKRYGHVDDGFDFAQHFIKKEQGRLVRTGLVSTGASTAVSLLTKFVPSLLGLGEVGWALAIVAGLLVGMIYAVIYLRQSGATMSLSELRKLANDVKRKCG